MENHYRKKKKKNKEAISIKKNYILFLKEIYLKKIVIYK